MQDLVEQLSLPQNLVSYHLRQLREGQLVTERRSAADERAIFYRLDLDVDRMVISEYLRHYRR